MTEQEVGEPPQVMGPEGLGYIPNQGTQTHREQNLGAGLDSASWSGPGQSVRVSESPFHPL